MMDNQSNNSGTAVARRVFTEGPSHCQFDGEESELDFNNLTPEQIQQLLQDPRMAELLAQ
jgi:hypothetical protein